MNGGRESAVSPSDVRAHLVRTELDEVGGGDNGENAAEEKAEHYPGEDRPDLPAGADAAGRDGGQPDADAGRREKRQGVRPLEGSAVARFGSCLRLRPLRRI